MLQHAPFPNDGLKPAVYHPILKIILFFVIFFLFIQQGGLSAQAFVRIEIEDINDNQPVFEQDTYVTSISSHTHPGTEIINVAATDRDSGIFGIVAYELVPGEFSSFFRVDSSTGSVFVYGSEKL